MVAPGSEVLPAALLASAITGGIPLLVQQFANRHQLRRDHDADARQLRDEKRERLREAYKVIPRAAQQFVGTAYQLDMISGKEEGDAERAGAYERLGRATATYPEAAVALALENVGDGVSRQFEEITACYRMYHADLRTFQREGNAGGVTHRQITDQATQLSNHLAGLTRTMNESLAQFEQPIKRPVKQLRWWWRGWRPFRARPSNHQLGN